jgi:GNAT superfamily N-acetyltransferase
MDDGVAFWGYDESGVLTAVMGIQEVLDVTLIRHAYTKSSNQRQGRGAVLLSHLLALAAKPVLIGTWADAGWAIHFYEKHGFQLVDHEEKNRLLRKYWTVPDRQVETSVVLADRGWRELKA